MHKSAISVITSLLFSAAVFGQLCTPVMAYSSDDYVSRLTEPDKNEESEEYKYYYSNDNAFTDIGFGLPNCTAYAWGRIYELTGSKPKLSTGNAGRWYTENIASGNYSYGCIPKIGAIACYDKYNNVDGHVAVVEIVSPDRSIVTVSESQYGGENFKIYKYKSDSSDHMSKYRFLGYIYTDETSGDFYGDAFKLVSSSGQYITYSENMNVSLNQIVSNTALQNFRFEPLENGSYRIWSVSEDVLLTHSNNTVYIGNNDNSVDTEWKIFRDSKNNLSISPADNDSSALAFNGKELIITNDTSQKSVNWNIERVTGLTPLNIFERSEASGIPSDKEGDSSDDKPGPEPQNPDLSPAPIVKEEPSDEEVITDTSQYLSIDWSSMKTDYYINEFPDISGISLMINETKISKLNIAKLEINYDFSKAGPSIVEVKYDGLTAYYPVMIFEDYERNEIVYAYADYILSNNNTINYELDLNKDNCIDSSDLLTALQKQK